MFSEPHDLHHEFPEFQHKIEQLLLTNPQFEELAEEYNKLDREVRRIELEIKHTSDAHLEDLKKSRLHLKDQLYMMLTQA